MGWTGAMKRPADEPDAPMLYEWAGGLVVLRRMIDCFYDRVEADDELVPLLPGRGLDPPPVERRGLVGRGRRRPHDVHRAARRVRSSYVLPPPRARHHAGPTAPVRRDPMSPAAHQAELPGDPEFRAAIIGYLEWGTRLAMENSQPDARPVEQAPTPRWGWGVAPPYQGPAALPARVGLERARRLPLWPRHVLLCSETGCLAHASGAGAGRLACTIHSRIPRRTDGGNASQLDSRRRSAVHARRRGRRVRPTAPRHRPAETRRRCASPRRSPASPAPVIRPCPRRSSTRFLFGRDHALVGFLRRGASSRLVTAGYCPVPTVAPSGPARGGHADASATGDPPPAGRGRPGCG